MQTNIRGVEAMSKKSKLRRRKKSSRVRKAKTEDIKFQLYLDSTYGLTRGELRRSARSYGAGKKQSARLSRQLRPGR